MRQTHANRGVPLIIPPSPPYSLKCREICLDYPENDNKSPQFCGFSLANRTGKNVLLRLATPLLAPRLAGHCSRPAPLNLSGCPDTCIGIRLPEDYPNAEPGAASGTITSSIAFPIGQAIEEVMVPEAAPGSALG